MAFTHLRAGEFFTAYFRLVPLIVGKGALMLPTEKARIASIDIGDIAEVVVAILTAGAAAGAHALSHTIISPSGPRLPHWAMRGMRGIILDAGEAPSGNPLERKNNGRQILG